MTNILVNYPHLFRACSITHKQAAGWPEQAIKVFHGFSKDSKVMKHYSHLSYNNLEQIQKKMNGLPTENAAELNRSIKCPGCGKHNPLYVETCTCGLPTEMKVFPDRQVSLESEIEAKVEKKVQEFIESRQLYDRMMERFMNALLEKSKQTPELLKAIGEIRVGLQEKRTVKRSEFLRIINVFYCSYTALERNAPWTVFLFNIVSARPIFFLPESIWKVLLHFFNELCHIFQFFL